MTLRLQLREGRELDLDVDPQAWTRAFEQALRNSEVVEVKDPNGGVLAINPHQVLYWTTEGQSEAAAAVAAVPLEA
jgi:hypothetical protein